MDEQNDIDKIEKKVKQAGKDIGRKTGKTAWKLAKQGVKALIHAIGIKTIIIIVVVVAIVVGLASLWYGLKESVFGTISDIAKDVTVDNSGNIEKITKIDGREIVIDSEELNQRVESWTKENQVSKELIGLSNDLSGLDKFLETEVVTSYPDLRTRDKIGTPLQEGEIQGCIQFHRRMLDGTTVVLEYMPYDEFSAELAKVGKILEGNQVIQELDPEQIYTQKEDIEKVYKNLEDKFTLADNMDLIIVNMVSTERKVIYSDYAKEEGHVDGDDDEYIADIEVTVINYQSTIQKYTMPFELCLALLMTSQNYEFCKAVADLAIDSKIIIDVQDNVTTNITTEVYSFNVDFEIARYIKYYTMTEISPGEYLVGSTQEYSPYPITGTDSKEVKPYKTTINTLKNNNIKLCVTQAKTWIADYNSEYTNIVKTPDIPDVTTVSANDTEFTEVPDYHGLVDTLTYGLPDNAHVVENRGVVKEKKTNKKTVISTQVTTNEYNKVNSKVEETPEKFLSLLKVDPNTGVFDVENLRNNSKLIQYENIDVKEKSSPQDSLISARDVLYKLLASNSKTVDLEDTMRYFINVYRGTVKAKKADEFEIYEPEEFIFIDGAWSALWKNNYTKEQFIQMVQAYIPPNGKGNKGRLFREFYEKHFIANAENYFDIATSYGLDPMFIFCIGIHESEYGTSNISYDKGNFWGWGAYDSSPYQSAIAFVGDASKGIDSVCKGIANNYISQDGDWYNWIKERGYEPTTIEGIGARYASDSSWASKVKYYITNIFGVSSQVDQIELTSQAQAKMVQWAEQQVGKSSFYNKLTGMLRASKGYCAAFVKCAYYEAGYGLITGANAIHLPHPNPITYTSTGQVDYTKIPIGACIVSNGSDPLVGHVALYVGNGYVIEAGGNTIVKQRIDESYGKTYGFLGWGYAANYEI